MNIFVLDSNPITSAIHHCDKHIVKMPLEVAQMMCALFPKGDAPYKRTHYNHPCTVWSRQTPANYQWLYNYGVALCQEYTSRYGKQHKSGAVIEWCNDNYTSDMFEQSNNSLTKFAQAMPDKYKQSSAVNAYRAYYINEKHKIATWKQNKPIWWAS
jgi:hypothetical protein